MLWGYLDDVVKFIVGEYKVSKDFRKLLKHYDLTRKDGDVIRENLFAYDLVIPVDKNENIVYDVWAIEEFKKVFIAYLKKKYPSREMDLTYLNNYKMNKEFFKEREEILKVNALLEEYMGKDKLSKQYLKDLSEYNLLSQYFEITLKFLSTPLETYENVSNIRDYVLEYLKDVSRKDELIMNSPQTIGEVIDFLIVNSNKDFIDFIYSHDEFNKEDRDSLNIINFISHYFDFGNNPNLMMECFYSKYNDLKYSYTIWDYDYEVDSCVIYLDDDEEDEKAIAINLEYEDLPNYKFGALSSTRFDALILLNELREYIQNNYDSIIKTEFKDKLIATKSDYYILDEIDDYSLNFLENLFLKEEYDDLIEYYHLSKEEGLEIMDACYVFCFKYRDYNSKLIRDYQIIEDFYLHFKYRYQFLSNEDRMPLEKFYEYTNYKKLDELTKDYQIKRYLNSNLEDVNLCRYFYMELKERDLLDYYNCMGLYDRAHLLDSEEKIREFLDEFINSYDFSKPQTLEEAIQYLIENSSREFIDEVYNSKQSDVSGLHFSLGMYIRNEFGINGRSNVRLLNDLSKSKYDSFSLWSDGDSDTILREFYDYVQEHYDEIIRNIEFNDSIDMYKFWI